uniref:Aquaporin n=1 Tax=Parastrongyloides trichosuri TaxID=131310 RepID=A0A0N4ZKK7_PARTI
MVNTNDWEGSITSKDTITVERRYTIINKVLAEYVACLIFVFIGSVSTLHGNIVSVAFAHGLTIFAGVSAFGGISGGHLNPAVTLALVLSKKCPPIYLLAYWPAQLLGGFSGGVLVRAILNDKQYNSILGGATTLNMDNTWWQGLITECVLTVILTLVIVMVAADRENFSLAPIAIGLTLSLSILGCGSISGASLNPARSLGPAAAFSIFGSYNSTVWNDHYIYWGGPLLGSIITATLYRSFFDSNVKERIF